MRGRKPFKIAPTSSRRYSRSRSRERISTSHRNYSVSTQRESSSSTRRSISKRRNERTTISRSRSPIQNKNDRYDRSPSKSTWRKSYERRSRSSMNDRNNRLQRKNPDRSKNVKNVEESSKGSPTIPVPEDNDRREKSDGNDQQETNTLERSNTSIRQELERSERSNGGVNSDRVITSIQSTLNYLIEEVQDLKRQRSKQSEESQEEYSPEPRGGHRKSRVVLEDMTDEQYKSFRDEVVQILSGLNDSLLLDHTKAWNEISSHVSKNIMPAIDTAINQRMRYNQVELKYVLQQLHRHRRESWQIHQNSERSKLDKKRKGTNSRRSDKKERRKRGIQHMYNTDDQVLSEVQPSSVNNSQYKKDIEKIFNEGLFHSDEFSETDDEKAQEEISRHIRPKNKAESDMHVIRVYDKPWRSSKVKRLLRHADKIGDNIQRIKVQRHRWYNDDLYKDDTKPPPDVPEWVVSSLIRKEREE